MRSDYTRRQENSTSDEKKKSVLTPIMRVVTAISDTLATSFSTIRDLNVVHYKVDGREESLHDLHMNGTNSAFYIGKFFKEDWLFKIKELFGKKEEHLYTPQFMEAILLFMFQNLPYGERANIVIGRSLSEIFNGPDDVIGTLTIDETKKMIRRIAKSMKIEPSRLHIAEMEEQEENKRLFEALRNPNNRTADGQVDMEKVFAYEVSRKEDGQVDSYIIAQMLYEAMKQSAPLSAKIRRRTIPDYKNKSEEELEHMKYYGMTEIAIRLMAILNGVYIHGGAQRQGVYDDIIESILEYDNFMSSNIPKLIELIKKEREKSRQVDTDSVSDEELSHTPDETEPKRKLERFRFETLHVDNRINKPQLEHVRAIAQIRTALSLLLTGLLTITIGAEMKEIKRKQQLRKEEAVIRKVTPEFSGRFPVHDMWERIDPDAMVPGNVRSTVYNIKTVLATRYGLSIQQTNELDSLIIDFMRRHRQDSEFRRITSSEGKWAEMAGDLFIEEDAVSLWELGIHTDRPYPDLEPHRAFLFGALSSQANVQLGPEFVMVNGEQRSMRIFEGRHNVFSFGGMVPPNYSVEYLGEIIDQESIYDPYELFVVKLPGGKYIVAREQGSKDPPSTDIARAAITSYIHSLRIYSFRPFMKYYGYFPLKPILPKYNFNVNPEDSHLSYPIEKYKDPFTGQVFEIAFYCTGHELEEKHVVVRKPGEQCFTSKAAMEFEKFLGLHR